jgi:putative IMPACT (imprinted ancient) family translation regulator
LEAEVSSEAVRIPITGGRAEVRERGSRFLAVAEPADSETSARAVRDAQRADQHDATHHVWAFRGADGAERWDDDGEPAGTGGRPILAAIESAGLADVAVVVTRWFGGTKLGTGGLARAYGRAAARALEGVHPVTVLPGRLVRIRYDWSDTGAIAAAVDAAGGHRVGERFDPGPELEVAVAVARSGALIAALRDATAGRAVCTIGIESLWVRDQA